MNDSSTARLVVQLGHSGVAAIHSLAFSPDGRLFLTGDSDGKAILWHAGTGAELRRFDDHTHWIWSVAFAPDGRRVLTGSRDSTAILWDAETGTRLASFHHGTSWIRTVAISPDGSRVLTGGGDGLIRLWNVTSGSEISRLEGHAAEVLFAAFSPDGSRIASSGRDGMVRVWDVASGSEVHQLRLRGDVSSVAFSPDGTSILAASGQGVFLWHPPGDSEPRRIGGPFLPRATSVAFSPDGALVLAGGDGVTLWDTETGERLRRFEGRYYDNPQSVAFSPDGRKVLFGGQFHLVVWDVLEDVEVWRMRPSALSLYDAAFAPGGHQVLTAGGDSAAHLWDLGTGRELRRFRVQGRVDAVDFSPDGQVMVTGGHDGTVRLWDIQSGAELRRFEPREGWVNSAVFSANGARVLTGSTSRAVLWDTSTGTEVLRSQPSADYPLTAALFAPDDVPAFLTHVDGVAVLLEVESGRELFRFEGHGEPVGALTFSSDGHHALTGSFDGTARLWDFRRNVELGRFGSPPGAIVSVAFSLEGDRLLLGDADGVASLRETDSGSELLRLTGHTQWITSGTFSPNGERLVTASWDGTTRLWDARTGTQLGALLSLAGDRWVVVSPDGRFDTNDLERIEGLHWIMPDDPFTPLPVEIFMRDYYEPRLLARILEGEEFPEVKGLGERNRVQPEVRVATVETSADGSATITVEVEGAERYFATGSSDSTLVRSGATDLRLFRNGQLVGWIDGPIDADPGAPRTFTFTDVRLPRTGTDSVTFSAYAFNDDRVKSLTDYHTVATPPTLAARPGTAYLITVGVDAYQSPEWNLRFAVDDARVIGAELGERLRANPMFDEVVTVPLVSDQDRSQSTTATKAAIRAVLDLLAGRDVSAETRSAIPHAEHVRPATPEDLVLISFSGHGYTGTDGVFYMLPSDIGEDAGRGISDDLLERAISSDELTLWLREVDAGDLTLIVDACHSAAAVEGTGFKPGPMGSRGLGQLAYDKGMQVLAASQAEDVALESDLLRQGLLTYALVRDGLEAEQADHEPADGTITLSEWLAYAVERVPALYEEVQAGEVQTWGRDVTRSTTVGGRGTDPLFQQPALFDFRRSGRAVVVDRASPGS